MSGTTDTSTPRQRMNFLMVLEGSGGGALPGLAANVASSPLPMPDSACNLLGVLPGATFAQGVARLQFRWANGQAGY